MPWWSQREPIPRSCASQLLQGVQQKAASSSTLLKLVSRSHWLFQRIPWVFQTIQAITPAKCAHPDVSPILWSRVTSARPYKIVKPNSKSNQNRSSFFMQLGNIWSFLDSYKGPCNKSSNFIFPNPRKFKDVVGICWPLAMWAWIFLVIGKEKIMPCFLKLLHTSCTKIYLAHQAHWPLA